MKPLYTLLLLTGCAALALSGCASMPKISYGGTRVGVQTISAVINNNFTELYTLLNAIRLAMVPTTGLGTMKGEA